MKLFTDGELFGQCLKVFIWIVFFTLDFFAIKDTIQQKKYAYELLQEQEERKKNNAE